MSIEQEIIRSKGKEKLIIHGCEDKVMPIQNTYKLFSFIPNAQFRVFGEH